MIPDGSERIENILMRVVQCIKAMTSELMANGDLSAPKDVFFHNSIEDFEYGQQGVRVGASSCTYPTRPQWLLGIAPIVSSVSESQEYKDARHELWDYFPDRRDKWDALGKLIVLLNRVPRAYVPDPLLCESDVPNLVRICTAQILGRPWTYVARVELTRLIVGTRPVSFTVEGFGHIRIRQVTVEDLEHEFPVRNFASGNVRPYLGTMMADLVYPSAVLTIESKAKKAESLVHQIKVALAVLRLFRPAGVDTVWHGIRPKGYPEYDSFGSLNSSFDGVRRYANALGRYTITQDDTDELARFWEKVVAGIPNDFFDRNKIAPINIAYQRYCDALLRQRPLEAKIANVIMGLEALLYPNGAHGELSFRLRTYAAKLLGMLGHSPETVEKDINDGYGIRSRYVHGAKHSDPQSKALLDRILNYLRVVIVTSIVIEVDKEDLVKVLKLSLISDASQLETLLEDVRDILA